MPGRAADTRPPVEPVDGVVVLVASVLGDGVQPVGHVVGELPLSVASGRRSLANSEVTEVDVIVNRLEAVDGVDAKGVTDGIAHQFAVPAGVLLGEQHIDEVAVGLATLQPVKSVLRSSSSLLWMAS